MKLRNVLASPDDESPDDESPDDESPDDESPDDELSFAIEDRRRPSPDQAQSDTEPDGRATVGDFSLDTTFEILMNRRRRDTLEYLLAHGGQSTLSDLAEHIAALENGIDVDHLSSSQRKRVYIGLYQCHLPRMDRADVVDFDKNRGTVVLRDEAEQLVEYLDHGRVHGDDSATDAELVRGTAVSAAIAAVVGSVGLRLFALVGGLSVESVTALVIGATLVVAVVGARATILGRIP
ncbi:hypothetical protein SAMN04487949_3638 [Halogranum gelatinilyticum]|uniref:DUF7344 domain-containing protein n=1 Tax=Halogranum gelatinilyticum TaxID=660521 RepID=A0A1G9ZH39_9EURY|nr:hypothetical protein [Halogranum gelatinilyticum]SDN19906.1 hypothetical protein SAMN04487949_3638 [Halogranum gelatinilyticum]